MKIPTFALAGKLTREYLLPPNDGAMRLDAPGGNLLYAAGGLIAWDSSVALISKVNRDYPSEWLSDFKKRKMNVDGIYIDESDRSDLRDFVVYTENGERSASNAVSHFARRQATFPKALLGYQAPNQTVKNLNETDALAPTARFVPKEIRAVQFLHVCPFDFTSQSQIVNLFKGGSQGMISLDPAPAYMKPNFWRDLRIVLQGVAAFLPSEEELRALFWGKTDDLWEMARQISDYGPRIVVVKRGVKGQWIYDAAANRRYEAPAYPIRLIDPTGLGDAFCGGFLVGYQRTRDAVQATLYGNVSASLKAEGIGPFSTLDTMPGLAQARLNALRGLVREF